MVAAGYEDGNDATGLRRDPVFKMALNQAPSGRALCSQSTNANQFRLFLHAGAYWLLWSLRALMPKRSSWRVAQFDTLRLRLIKMAARVIEMKTMVKVHLPTATPCRDILCLVLGRLPRLVT